MVFATSVEGNLLSLRERGSSLVRVQGPKYSLAHYTTYVLWSSPNNLYVIKW